MLLSRAIVLLLVAATSAADVTGAEDYYSEYRRDYVEEGTEEPLPIRGLFDVDKWYFDHAVVEVEGEEGTKSYEFYNKETLQVVTEELIPEMCYLTSDNITIYNSFFLDRQFLEEMENTFSTDCRDFKCEAAHYFKNNGPQVFADFFNAESYKEGLEVIRRELSKAFDELNMCTCGREFFKAVFKSAPYYHANALFALVDNDEDSIVQYGKVARSIDTRSASRFFDRLMDGLCVENNDGRCIDSILNALMEVMDMIHATIDDWDAYIDGDRKFKKSQDKRCDALFGPIAAWEDDDRDADYYEGEEFWELIFNRTAKVANNFYCEKKCKKSRGPVYPCCLRRMMEDTKMFDNVARVIESIYKVIPATDWFFRWDGFYELDSNFHDPYHYPLSEMSRILKWSIPEHIRDDFMRTVHAAKYCDGKTVKCSN